MNSNPLESQVCVTQFWKHDKEDSDFDHDLLGLLQPKKSISRKARAESKIGSKSQDTNVNSPNFTKLDTLGIQKVQTETKEHSERKMTAQKLRRNLSQPSRNNITNFEEIGNQSPNPSQPKFNPDYGQITQRNCTPVIYPSQQEGSKKILLIKKPSFNVGLAKITDDQIAPQHKNHMKVSALLESRRHTPSQHSSLQSLENINARTRSHNQMLIPIQKLAESGSLNLPEETTPNRYPHSPFKSHPDSKTPLRDREIISKSPDDIDYMGFSKQQKDWVKSSRSLSKEKPGLITPSIPVNIWTAEGNGDGLRSLIRLPKLTKKTLGDNSPFFEAVEERSTSRKASRDNITGLILEKKLIALSPDRAFNGSPIFQKTTSTS